MPTELRLGSKPPHDKQREFLSMLFDQGDGAGAVVTGHGVAGRGGGKTEGAVLALLKSAIEINPGRPHYYSAPTIDDLRRIFIRKWEGTVPRELYRLNKNERTITLVNGSVIDLISRQSTTGKSYDPAKGKEWAGGIDDELPQDSNANGWHDLHLCIRDPKAAIRWHASISTPKIGWYKSLVIGGDDPHVHWSSWDNPYLPTGWADAQYARLDHKTADEQLYARWVAMEGLCWDKWGEDEWPNGNRHWARFDPSKPYVLGIDLGGGASSYQVVQRVAAIDRNGRQVFPGEVEVVVAEWTPNRKGVAQILPEIAEWAGNKLPIKVIVGTDVASPEAIASQTPEMYVRQIWGAVNLDRPTGYLALKDVQGNVLRALILNTAGERRFCVSSHLQSFYADNKLRGVLNVMNEDTWPALGSKDTFTKDKGRGQGLEDSRDCALYLAVCLHPELTQFAPLTKTAA